MFSSYFSWSLAYSSLRWRFSFLKMAFYVSAYSWWLYHRFTLTIRHPNSVMSFGIGSYIIYKCCNINYFTSSGVGHHSQKSENNHANGTERARAKSAARKKELIFVWAQLSDFFSRMLSENEFVFATHKTQSHSKNHFLLHRSYSFLCASKMDFCWGDKQRNTRVAQHTHTKKPIRHTR